MNKDFNNLPALVKPYKISYRQCRSVVYGAIKNKLSTLSKFLDRQKKQKISLH